MNKELGESGINDGTTNNIVNNYGTIFGDVTAAQYSIMSEMRQKSIVQYVLILKTVNENPIRN